MIVCWMMPLFWTKFILCYYTSIGLYYGITIAIVSLATAMTVLTLNIHHKGEEGVPVPRYIKFICFSFLARLLCLKLQRPYAVESGITVSAVTWGFSASPLFEVYLDCRDSFEQVDRISESENQLRCSVHRVDMIDWFMYGTVHVPISSLTYIQW